MQGLEGLALRERSLPIAVVGSGLGGDCVPSDSNHGLYYAAASAPAWEVSAPVRARGGRGEG